MTLPTTYLTARPRASIAVAAILFAAIFALRFATPDAGDGVTFLFVLPIVLVAVGFGGLAGLAAGGAAFVLSTIWVLAADVSVSPLGYLVRAVVFGFVGFLVGRFATSLRQAQRDAARHFELSLDMISTAGFDGRFKTVNPAFEKVLGYREEDLVGRPFLDFVHPDDREMTEIEAAALSDGESVVQFQNRYLDSHGEVHWLEWASVPIPDENIIYGVARDVTERKALEQELESLSHRDPLTGVYNRRRFDKELSARLSDAQHQGRGGALLLIDLDRFKRINDELGHAAGDLALCEVARVLDENTRGGDVVGRDADGLVARVGGDEFAVLLSDVGPVEAAAVGERLVAALEITELHFEGTPVPIAISVGVAPFEGRHAVGPEDLLALADRAMYVVKAGGGSGAGEADPAGGGPSAEPA